MEDVPLPVILYKYRRWENLEHRRMLTDAEFMFERPYAMCPFSELQFDTTGLGWHQLIEFYIDRARSEFPMLDEREQKTTALKFFRTSVYHNPQFVHSQILDLFNQFDAAYGALSLAGTCVNSTLWNNFASTGHGFCVGLAPKPFRDVSSKGGAMQYYEQENKPVMNFPALNPDDYIEDIMNIFFSLPERYKNEDEYRFFKAIPGVIQMPKTSIKEVVIGYAMNNEKRQELVETVFASLPEAVILQSHLDETTGRITVSPQPVDGS